MKNTSNKVKTNVKLDKQNNNNKSVVLLKKFNKWINLIESIFKAMYKEQVDQKLWIIYKKQVTNLASNNGKVATLKYFKKVRSILYKFMADDSSLLEGGVALTKDKIPIFLQELIPSVRAKHKPTIQALLSLTNIGRLFKGVGKVNVTTIETENKVNVADIAPENIIQDFVSRFHLKEQKTSPAEFWIRSSHGPLGPAMTSITEEAKLLTESQYNSVKELLRHSIGDDAKSDVLDVFEQCRHDSIPLPESYTDKFSKKYKHSRKITVVEDKELKDRIIAILDYWTQTSLKPYHKSLSEMLKGFSQDCTFDQASGFEKMRRVDSNYFSSLDLKAATDLMPLKLQLALFNAVFSEEEGVHWENLLIGEPYFVQELNKSVRYKTGQPMGAYSSWPMMAITHHLIVYIAIRRITKSKKEIESLLQKYVLLGDDIAIADEPLATSYKGVIHDLKMSVQYTKTIESKDSFEFVKRFIHKGEEYSPLPLGELSYSSKYYWTIASFLQKAKEVGYSFSNSELTWAICNQLYIGRKKKYMHNKILNYTNSINPYRDDWNEELDSKITKWIPNDINPFSCNTVTTFKEDFIIQAFINEIMKFVHETLVTTVKNVNKWFKNQVFTDYYNNNDKYHPLVHIINNCCDMLKEIEYSNSADPVEETAQYYKIKISIKEFLLIPNNIESVFSKSGHQAKLKARAVINDKVLTSLDLLQNKVAESLKDKIPLNDEVT